MLGRVAQFVTTSWSVSGKEETTMMHSSEAQQEAQLLQRRRAAQCFVALNISLSRSRSFTVIRSYTHMACVNPYKYSIVAVPVSRTLNCRLQITQCH